MECPYCGSLHTITHGYFSAQLGKFSSGKSYFFQRRRLKCKDCGRTFVEDNPLARWYGDAVSQNNLRRIRAERKLSQKEVYESAGISLPVYQTYESVDNPVVPPLAHAREIAEVLNVNIEELWNLKDIERVTLAQEKEKLEKEEDRRSSKFVRSLLASFKVLSSRQKKLVADELHRMTQ